MQKKSTWGWSALIAILVIVLVAALVPWKSIGSRQKPIRVVTGMDFYGEVAEQIAGSHGQVTSFINNPSVDPHDYQPGTKEARTGENANVVVENGLGYDQWMNKLTRANAGQNAKIINVGQLAGKKVGDNEHIWYQPATMEKLAHRLAKQYSKLDPEHAADYQQNAQRYRPSLRPLNP